MENETGRTVISIPVSKPFRPTEVRISVALLGFLSGLYFAYVEYTRLALYPAISMGSATANLGIFSGLLLTVITGWYLKHKFGQRYQIILS